MYIHKGEEYESEELFIKRCKEVEEDVGIIIKNLCMTSGILVNSFESRTDIIQCKRFYNVRGVVRDPSYSFLSITALLNKKFSDIGVGNTISTSISDINVSLDIVTY